MGVGLSSAFDLGVFQVHVWVFFDHVGDDELVVDKAEPEGSGAHVGAVGSDVLPGLRIS